jgi:hypothetical protein
MTMITIHRYATDSLYGLTDTLGAYTDAGIDPAFDDEMEELQRQFAELRFSCNHH